MDLTAPSRLSPREVPDLAGLETDEDFLRAAEGVAPAVLERVAAGEAARAWAERVRELRANGGRFNLPEAERRAFVERAVRKAGERAAADADAWARFVAEIAAMLRDRKRSGPAAAGG